VNVAYIIGCGGLRVPIISNAEVCVAMFLCYLACFHWQRRYFPDKVDVKKPALELTGLASHTKFKIKVNWESR